MSRWAWGGSVDLNLIERWQCGTGKGWPGASRASRGWPAAGASTEILASDVRTACCHRPKLRPPSNLLGTCSAVTQSYTPVRERCTARTGHAGVCSLAVARNVHTRGPDHCRDVCPSSVNCQMVVADAMRRATRTSWVGRIRGGFDLTPRAGQWAAPISYSVLLLLPARRTKTTPSNSIDGQHIACIFGSGGGEVTIATVEDPALKLGACCRVLASPAPLLDQLGPI